MNKERNDKKKEKDIEALRERIYQFVIRVVNLVKELPNTLLGNRIGGQLLDAATSVGANFEEACAAFSKADFTYKLSISRKEAFETELLAQGCPGFGIAPPKKDGGNNSRINGNQENIVLLSKNGSGESIIRKND